MPPRGRAKAGKGKGRGAKAKTPAALEDKVCVFLLHAIRDTSKVRLLPGQL